MKILVTGAAGFIGRQLCCSLAAGGYPVIPVVRTNATADEIAIGDIGPDTDWQAALALRPDVIIHLAGRVHMMGETSAGALAAYRTVNVEGTLNLTRQAAAAGVRRLVYLSSIKVNGEITSADRPFRADDAPAPTDPYSVSKAEAELGLQGLAQATGLEVVIIRSPLVYGPGVKGNFATMVRCVLKGVPLPLAAVIHNRRSLVALENLVDLILVCVNHPAAGNQIFLVSDGEDLSTADLLKRLGAAHRKPARLLYVPTALLKLVADAVKSPSVYQRLCSSLQLDIKKTRDMLGWTPPLSIDDGLRSAAQYKQ